MKTLLLALFLFTFTVSTVSAMQSDTIGHIQTIKGKASILRGSKTEAASKGSPVYAGDTIKTSKTGAVGIVLIDETTLSLGPDSTIILKDYIFNPKENRFSIIARMAKGTFSYLSGIIGKLSPESIHLEIPEATIAVRGTRLLIKVDGQNADN